MLVWLLRLTLNWNDLRSIFLKTWFVLLTKTILEALRRAEFLFSLNSLFSLINISRSKITSFRHVLLQLSIVSTFFHPLYDFIEAFYFFDVLLRLYRRQLRLWHVWSEVALGHFSFKPIFLRWLILFLFIASLSMKTCEVILVVNYLKLCVTVASRFTL